MAKSITYSLTGNQNDSSGFYSELSLFTDLIIRDLNPETEKYLTDFCHFVDENKVEKLRSRNEYLVELLMIGVYWNNYSGNAVKTGSLSKKLLKVLYKQRKKFPKHKPEIDKVRGFLAYSFLRKNNQKRCGTLTSKMLNQLLNWLSATGEFNEEVLRLNTWAAFLNTKNAAYTENLIKNSMLFADYFSLKGMEVLGEYTQHIGDFHQTILPSYKYREDYFLASRRENEYFLNMFAAEVLNRGLKKGFTETKKKVLLLPTCMRSAPATGCKAISDGKELVCAACCAECNIGKVSSEMKKQGITSYLIPHSSEFSKFLVKWKNSSDTSLIGVACVLNLITGGYEMKRLNISSQCVFLDYCGCKKHWDTDGIATSLDVTQLKKIVQKPKVSSEELSMVFAD
jgi:uncharacterized protein